MYLICNYASSKVCGIDNDIKCIHQFYVVLWDTMLIKFRIVTHTGIKFWFYIDQAGLINIIPKQTRPISKWISFPPSKTPHDQSSS